LHPAWEEALSRTEDWLDAILKPLQAKTVLDCTCGTGLQSIALARRGYSVTGSDLSAAMLRRARLNAIEAGLDISWVRADIRRLEETIRGQFDAVITCGNSLLHLSTRDNLYAAIKSMSLVVREGGHLLIDQSDGEASLLAPHPFASGRVTLPDGLTLSMYTTEERKGEIITLSMFIARDTPDGPEVSHTRMRLRIPVREELIQLLSNAGFAQVADISRKGSITLLAEKTGLP
ncbi:MAG: class I SAM-dependent methyltransferase, partial [Dehalococcoidia bacterium]|nr:class I SAM-dependent methyltransferase [Dehalococcoidia bacterium]